MSQSSLAHMTARLTKYAQFFHLKAKTVIFFFIPFIISKSVKVTMPQLEHPLHFLQPSSVNR